MLRKSNGYPCWPAAVGLMLVVVLGGCHKGSTTNEPVSTARAAETPVPLAARPASPPVGKPASLPPDIDTATLEMLRELRDHWTTNGPNPKQ